MVKLGRVFEEPFLEDMYEKDAIKAHMRPNFVLIPVFVFLGIDKINSHTKKVSFLPSTLLRAFNIDSTKLSIEEKKISHRSRCDGCQWAHCRSRLQDVRSA